jgi:hypothetical protein
MRVLLSRVEDGIVYGVPGNHVNILQHDFCLQMARHAL